MTFTTCTAICGDMFRVQGELCDDADNADGDGCLAD